MATVDVWITAGQSNMAGRGDSTLVPATNPARVIEYNSGGNLAPMVDPGVVSPYNAKTGSCLPAFANAFTAASQRLGVWVRTAVGGTALLEANGGTNGGWWAGGNRYLNAVQRATDALDALALEGHTIGTLNVLWHQGEQDASAGMDPATLQTAYTAALIDLLARFRADVDPGLNIYVCRMGTRSTRVAGSQAVRDAQDTACATTDGLVMAYTRCVDFPSLGWMQPDAVHYTQAGLNDMGTVAGQFAAADLGFDVPPPEPVTSHNSVAALRLMSIL